MTPATSPTRTGDQLGTRLQLWASYLSLGDRVAAGKVLDGLGPDPAGSALADAARLVMDGRMREAYALLDRRRDEFPESRLLDLPAARLALIAGHPDHAVALLEERLPDLATGIEPVTARNVMPALDLVAAWQRVGQRARARDLLDRIERYLDGPHASPLPVFVYQRARAHALAGERDRAWAALDRAHAAGQRNLWALDLLPQPHFYVDPVAADPAFAELQGHPRLAAWLGRIASDNARQLAALRSAQAGGPVARAPEAKSEQG
jgi:tetratricopeptide (TPR) repeat protein